MRVVFVKLGGSLITDKRVASSFRQPVMDRLAAEISAALKTDPDLRLLIGHGSGSFGHVAASQYRTIEGVHTPEEWRAFAHVATVAAELNYLVASSLEAAQVPVWRIQPSASTLARDGQIVDMALDPVHLALQKGIVPLVYGDVSLDEVRGGTIISTEKIFFYLARHLPVSSILLLGEVDGVYDPQGSVIPRITPENVGEIEKALGGSAGTDVTGGMESKVRDMVALTVEKPSLQIRILNGMESGLLRDVLLEQGYPGTLIESASNTQGRS